MRAQGRNLHGDLYACCPRRHARSAFSAGARDDIVLLVLVLLALLPLSRWPGRSPGPAPTRGAVAVTGGTGSCTQIEELWPQAQSAPSASRIPCVQAFPAGVAGVLAVRDGESVLKLSHASLDINLNTGGQPWAATEVGEVTVRLTASCAVPTTGRGKRSRRESDASRPKDPPAHPKWSTCSQAVVSSTGQSSALARRASLLDQAQRAVTSGPVMTYARPSGATPTADSSLT